MNKAEEIAKEKKTIALADDCLTMISQLEVIATRLKSEANLRLVRLADPKSGGRKAQKYVMPSEDKTALRARMTRGAQLRTNT